ncbi:MAG: hypothetical protein AAF267_21445 [Deinococcota bacterium]
MWTLYPYVQDSFALACVVALLGFVGFRVFSFHPRVPIPREVL